MLIDYRSEIYATDKMGNNSLILAVESDGENLDCVEHILEKDSSRIND